MNSGAHGDGEAEGQKMRERLLSLVVVLFAWVGMYACDSPAIVGAQEKQVETSTEPVPPKEEARETYLGRQIAPYMTYHGAGWLIRDSRNREEATDRVIEQLGLQPGMVLCDLGCGNGFYTLRFARQVAPRGLVYAVDIQPEMLQMLAARTARLRADSVKPVLGEVNNPQLPAAEIDMVFMADVYHEFSHPQSMLYWIRRALKPEGVIALVEFREEDPMVPILPEHKMSKSQILKEFNANGLKLVREFNDLPWQHLMFFARDDSPLKEIEAVPFAPAN